MYMYIQCTYMCMIVCNLVKMYKHVCTRFRDVCTVLPNLVQVVRIPDDHYLHCSTTAQISSSDKLPDFGRMA